MVEQLVVQGRSLPTHVHLGFEASLKSGKSSEYFASWTAYKRERGMTRVYDMIDRLGDLPYEFASTAALTDFYEKDGFKLEKLVENINTGCHEFLFRRNA